jgi:hypothetical protein
MKFVCVCVCVLGRCRALYVTQIAQVSAYFSDSEKRVSEPSETRFISMSHLVLHICSGCAI